VDEQVFPAVALAKQVGTKGGTAPAVMNGANEVAVAQFLAGALKFSQIVPLVSRVVEMHLAGDFVSDQHLTIEEVTKAAKWAQQSATAQLDK
jgi:1-deoxy-D-xylulose-5-phosphate reductoisomerase